VRCFGPWTNSTIAPVNIRVSPERIWEPLLARSVHCVWRHGRCENSSAGCVCWDMVPPHNIKHVSHLKPAHYEVPHEFLDRFPERFAAFQHYLLRHTQGDLLPMPEWDDQGKNAGVKLARRANIPTAEPHLFARAERWLRPAEELDDMIRRWVIPVSFGITVHRTSAFPSSKPIDATQRL
jgi:hypothetical protein